MGLENNGFSNGGGGSGPYVPYTGATGDVDLGLFDLSANQGNFGIGMTIGGFGNALNMNEGSINALFALNFYSMGSILSWPSPLSGTPLSMSLDTSTRLPQWFDGFTTHDFAFSSTSYSFIDSLVNSSGNVSLVNDNSSPGSNQYYGTDGSSAFGYHSLPSSSGGTVTSVSLYSPGGTVNASGTVTSSGTLDVDLASITFGSSYTNANITVDSYGRVTSASNGSSGSSGTVTSINTGTGLTGGTITTSGTISIANSTANTLAGYDSGGNFSDVSIGSGLSLSGGTLSTTGGSMGTVTSVGISSSTLSTSGGPITTSGTLDVDLNTSGVSPGSYTSANISVDSYGRITSATNGSSGAMPSGNQGDIQIYNSGNFGNISTSFSGSGYLYNSGSNNWSLATPMGASPGGSSGDAQINNGSGGFNGITGTSTTVSFTDLFGGSHSFSFSNGICTSAF